MGGVGIGRKRPNSPRLAKWGPARLPGRRRRIAAREGDSKVSVPGPVRNARGLCHDSARAMDARPEMR